MSIRIMILPALLALTLTACAQETPAPEAETSPGAATAPTAMTVDRLDGILRRLDSELRHENANWQLTIQERSILVVADAGANRMRIMTPIIRADALPPETWLRMLQANFDSALDARYAIAQDMLFSVFIHPLGSLTPEFLLSGISQVHGAAETFGTTYSSGAIVFGGGDSSELNRDLLRKLQEAEAGDAI
ncbi:MAG: hypothetical protein AAGE01_01540 [Pseudomonadota bacterium]